MLGLRALRCGHDEGAGRVVVDSLGVDERIARYVVGNGLHVQDQFAHLDADCPQRSNLNLLGATGALLPLVMVVSLAVAMESGRS